MARRPLLQVEAEREEARAVAGKLGLAPRRPRKKKGPAPKLVARLEEEARGFAGRGEWAGAQPRHFVALFRVLHRLCYGVDCADLAGGVEFLGAASAAGKMIREQFGGSNDAFAAYLRWAWRRERETERWRRDNGQPGSVLTWRRVFVGAGCVTRYRIEQERRNQRG
jgi:hypothetical protein